MVLAVKTLEEPLADMRWSDSTAGRKDAKLPKITTPPLFHMAWNPARHGLGLVHCAQQCSPTPLAREKYIASSQRQCPGWPGTRELLVG